MVTIDSYYFNPDNAKTIDVSISSNISTYSNRSTNSFCYFCSPFFIELSKISDFALKLFSSPINVISKYKKDIFFGEKKIDFGAYFNPDSIYVEPVFTFAFNKKINSNRVSNDYYYFCSIENIKHVNIYSQLIFNKVNVYNTSLIYSYLNFNTHIDYSIAENIFTLNFVEINNIKIEIFNPTTLKSVQPFKRSFKRINRTIYPKTKILYNGIKKYN